MKKLITNLISLYLISLLSMFPALANTASIEMTATVVPVASFSIESSGYDSFAVKSTANENEAILTTSENTLDFGKVDFTGFNRGSARVDQVSRIKNGMLVPGDTAQHDGTVYIIGAPEDEYAVRVTVSSYRGTDNAKFSIHKESSGHLDLYYSEAGAAWQENGTVPGDINHPAVTEQPSYITVTEAGYIDLDFALKVSASTPAGFQQSTIVFTLN